MRGYPVALEGAQKLKEISYVHAEAYPSSELKHGPLALDRARPADRRDRARRRAAGQEPLDASSRSAPATAACIARRPPLAGRPGRPRDPRRRAAQPELDPILLGIPLQLLAYHAAVALGRDVDQPRNLAKSVTVE